MSSLTRFFRSLFFLLLLLPAVSLGQAVINLDTNNFTVPDSTTFLDSVTFTVRTFKVDSGNYTGNVELRIGRISGSTFNLIETQTQAAQYPNMNAIQDFNLTVLVDTGRFLPGNNNIAIYTVLNGNNSIDTLYAPLWVRDTTLLSLNPPIGLSPDTIILSDTLFASASIQNVGTASPTGPVWLILGIIDSAQPGVIIPIDSTQVTGTLAPGDSQIVNINTQVTTPSFSIGGNGVVIWPRAPDADAVDSISKNVIVIDPVGIENPWEQFEALTLFPNPAKDLLFWQFGGKSVLAEYVRLSDIHGQLIYEESNTQQLNLSTYAKGIYFLEVTLDNERSKTFKIIKQ